VLRQISFEHNVRCLIASSFFLVRRVAGRLTIRYALVSMFRLWHQGMLAPHATSVAGAEIDMLLGALFKPENTLQTRSGGILPAADWGLCHISGTR
jgi:hypothetical protein